MSARDLLERFAGIVGATHVMGDVREMAGYATDWRKRYFGAPLAVVRPGSTAEVLVVGPTVCPLFAPAFLSVNAPLPVTE